MTSASDLQVALAGRYTIERELGQGGMATVYLAHDREHQRDVALKVLRPELSGVLGGERFAREIAIAARLSHPNILSIHEAGSLEVSGSPPLLYFAMPYVPGQSLRERLDAESQLPMDEAIGIARQVAAGLDHAHRQGVIHRDIKPENILLQDGQALVADFGIARALDAAGGERLTETGLALGTPAYMSPEQGAGSTHLDGRADIYALGCVLYEMLAGEPPFTGPTAHAVLARHAVDPVPTLRALRPSVGPGLRRVVLRALAKVPADRYPTAGDLAAALETAAHDTTAERGLLGHEAAGDSRVTGGRRRLAIAVLAGVAVIAVALVVKARSGVTPAVPVDPAVVAIAPFSVSADPSLGYLRDGMVDLLATKLGGTLVLRPIDSRTLLTAWHQAAGGGALSRSKARGVTTRLGAGRFVEGEIVRRGSRVRLSASILQLPGGEQSTVSVEGPADSVTPLVDQLAARLLVRAAHEPAQRYPDLDNRPLPFIRTYLDAWVHVRHFHNERAIEELNGLLGADSSFALAALALATTDWDGGEDGQRKGVLAAWRLRDRLTLRDQAYLRSLAGSTNPLRTRPREQLAALERYTRVAPNDPYGWLHFAQAVGEGPLFDFPSDAERSNVAAARVLALDPTMWEVFAGFAETAAYLRDTAGMMRGLRATLARDSTSPGSLLLQWEVATTLGDTARARRAALNDSMVSARPDDPTNGAVWDMGRFFLREGLGGRDLDLVMQRSFAVSPTGHQQRLLQHRRFLFALMRGRADGVPVPDWWDSDYAQFWYVLAALFADGDPAIADTAGAAIERLIGRPRTEAWCCLDRFAAAEYALAHGHLSLARQARRDLARNRSSGPDSAEVAEEYRGYALIVAAQIATQDGEPHATERLHELDSVLTVDPPSARQWEWVGLFGGLVAARLHEDRGEFGAALAAIRHRIWNSGEAILVTYHREEGRIAAEAGDTAGAIRAYERYLGIRGDAEPRLQRQVQEVRAELASLERAYRHR